MRKNKVKNVCRVLALLMCMNLAGCKTEPSNGEVTATPAMRGLDVQTFTQMSLSGKDRLGREITPCDRPKNDKERYVGMFYLCWLGNEPTKQDGIYNITELMKTEEGRAQLWNYTDPDPNISPLGKFHFVNEPLYGYYNSSDEWVVTRHLEMLTAAGIDYLYIDVSNGNIYDRNAGIDNGKEDGGVTVLLNTALKLYEQGMNVPKMMFFCNSYSGNVADNLYETFYKSGKYEDIWFKPYGKPMICAITENNNGASDMRPGVPDYVPLSKKMQAYFDVRESQWPVPSSNQIDNGFQWMCWTHPQHINGNMISVTPAQHDPESSKYSDMHKQTSRGYDYKDVANPIHSDWESGINFARQWETVFTPGYEERINFVNITGWNEWTPLKNVQMINGKPAPGKNGQAVFFVDGFTAEYSRDIEPDRNYYKDNFYLQTAQNVRKFKYSASRKYDWSSGVTYADAIGDAIARDYYGFDLTMRYTDTTNRNDIANIEVSHTATDIIFKIYTAETLTRRVAEDKGYMNLLLNTYASGNNFEGYQYAINRSADGNAASVEVCTGGYTWQEIGKATIAYGENFITLQVPRSVVGLENSIKFEFKVTDNVTTPSDIMEYYVSGDSAPIGRLNYAYGY